MLLHPTNMVAATKITRQLLRAGSPGNSAGHQHLDFAGNDLGRPGQVALCDETAEGSLRASRRETTLGLLQGECDGHAGCQRCLDGKLARVRRDPVKRELNSA